MLTTKYRAYAARIFISAARRQIATSSPCWLRPTCSNSTIPASERDRLRRTDITVVRARIVSPWNTGFGKRTSVMPRLATVVPSVVSPTLIPITRPSVKMLLTSGRPNSVVLANSASRCSGCGFIVMVVNSTLSVSVTVRVSACSNTCPSENSSKYRPAISPSRSMALEHRTALLDEGGDRLLVVLGKGTTRLVLGFEVEHGLEALGLGREQVALDVGQRNARPVGDTARQCHRLGLQFVVGHDLVDDAEPSGFIGIDDIGREVEFARLGSADQ